MYERSNASCPINAAEKASLPHGGLKIGDTVLWAGEHCRVTGVYDGCDEIVIEQLDDPGGFDVLWQNVERVPDQPQS